MDTVVRGATVLFAVNFTDVNGEPANPISANLHIAYRRNKLVQNAVIALARNGDTWSTAWESAV